MSSGIEEDWSAPALELSFAFLRGPMGTATGAESYGNASYGNISFLQSNSIVEGDYSDVEHL